MLLFLCSVFLIATKSTVISLDCPVGTDKVPDCFGSGVTAIGNTLKYDINVDDYPSDWMICPRADNNLKWSITILDISHSPITTGIFCTPQGISYNSSQICMDSNGTMHVQSSLLTKDKDNGLLTVEFISSILNVTVPIRYGIPGVYPIDSDVDVITVNESDPITFGFVIFVPLSLQIPIEILFNGSPLLGTGGGPQCVLNGQDRSQVATVSLGSATVGNSGNYTARDMNNLAFQGTIQLNVIPNPTPPPSSLTTSSVPSSTLSTSNAQTQPPSSPTPTVTETGTPTGTSATLSDPFSGSIVWVVVGVGVFFGVVVIVVLVVLIGICCYANRRSPRSNTSSPIDNSHAHMSDGSPTRPVKSDKPRHSSTSSERPLTKGGSTPSVHSSSHDTTTNYTAVYCSSEYSQCGTILKEKHGELIHIIDSLESIRLSLIQSHCTDILLFTDPSDSVFKEIISCGVDPLRPDSRNKLRIIKFVSVDSVPANTIGVNGFRFVLVEGPPDLSTLLTAISKAEYPELVKDSSSTHQHESPSSYRHDSVTSAGPRIDEHEPLSPDDDNSLKTTNKLLKKFIDLQIEGNAKSLEIQKENMELDRQRNEMMEQQMVAEDNTTCDSTV